ncbi:MAG: GNAT family N-acetyltransferase [Flavobacteriales bacterium]|nr:GNAT family N-acetyltransferase [Flavobacteriales bacterium]
MILTTTERLVLRDLEDHDAANVLLLNSDPDVLKYVHDVPFSDMDAARAWIANIQHQLPLGIGRWAIETKDGRWIGRCSLRRYADGEVLMGYRLLREHWGNGYASETARGLLDRPSTQSTSIRCIESGKGEHRQPARDAEERWTVLEGRCLRALRRCTCVPLRSAEPWLNPSRRCSTGRTSSAWQKKWKVLRPGSSALP